MLGLRYPEDRLLPVTNLIRDPKFTEYFSRNFYDEPLHINSPGDNSKRLEIQIALFGENDRLIIVRDISQLHRLEMMRKDFVANVSPLSRTPCDRFLVRVVALEIFYSRNTRGHPQQL